MRQSPLATVDLVIGGLTYFIEKFLTKRIQLSHFPFKILKKSNFQVCSEIKADLTALTHNGIMLFIVKSFIWQNRNMI